MPKEQNTVKLFLNALDKEENIHLPYKYTNLYIYIWKYESVLLRQVNTKANTLLHTHQKGKHAIKRQKIWIFKKTEHYKPVMWLELSNPSIGHAKF